MIRARARPGPAFATPVAVINYFHMHSKSNTHLYWSNMSTYSYCTVVAILLGVDILFVCFLHCSIFIPRKCCPPSYDKTESLDDDIDILQDINHNDILKNINILKHLGNVVLHSGWERHNWKSCSDILQDIKKTRKCFPPTSFRLGHNWKSWHWPLAGHQPKTQNMVPTPFRLPGDITESLDNDILSCRASNHNDIHILQDINRKARKYSPPFRLGHNWKSYSDIPHAGYQPKSKEYGLDDDILQAQHQPKWQESQYKVDSKFCVVWCKVHIAVRI